MKTTVKKLNIFALTLVLALTLYIPKTLAAPSPAGSGTLTVTSTGSSPQSFDGRTINAYKLFYVTSISGDNITYQVNPVYQSLLAGVAGINISGKSDSEINHELIAWLETQQPANSETIKTTTQAIQEAIKIGNYAADAAQTGGTGATAIQFAPLDFGYYLILDANDLSKNPQMASTFPVLTTFSSPAQSINVKSDMPTIDKTINGGPKGVSAEIGDTLSYTITGKVPNTDGFNTYEYKIMDTLSAGLSFNNDISIHIDGTDVTTDAIITSPDAAYTFSAVIPMLDVGGQPLYAAGESITLVYSATINENALIGSAGNANDAQLIYSNNPLDESQKDTYTVPDQPKVYAFGLNVYKLDGENNPLNGAIFTLSGSGSAPYYSSWANSTGTDGSFVFNGLKTGTTYTLTEVSAPSGYKILTTPVNFELSAVYNADGSLETLNAINVSGGHTININAMDSGQLDLTIVNVAGSKLPNTGGRGTIIFTIVGLALIGGAVLILILSRKNKGTTK